MVKTIVDGTFRQTNLTNESPEYLAKREELRLAEIELMRQRERVAELRRHLPKGAPMQDYAFQEGPRELSAGDAPVRTTRLSELFTKPNRSLVIYHLMYGKRETKPCPMCTAWLRILTSPWWPPPTSPLSGRTLALAAGRSCACSAPATARSSTTLAAKTAKGIRTRQFPFSPATPTARCDISIPRILGWPPTSKSAASISLLPSGTSWTSSRKAAATGTPVSTTAPKSRPPPRR